VVEAVKFLKGSDDLIGGLAIPFGGPNRGKDLDGEAFGPDTDFALDWYPQGRPLIYHHGLDGAMKRNVQGYQIDHEITDEGIWARVQLNKAAKYHATVKRLVERGALLFSSGTMPHLVEQDASGHIKAWPWMELSLTPIASNPLAQPHFMKATELIDDLEAAKLPIPHALVAAALKALDEVPTDDEDEGLPAGLKFAEHADRMLADVEEFRDRMGSLVELRAKAGRVLSATTRERLSRHPASLRELADDLDGLLSEADADKIAGKAILDELRMETERVTSRLLGVSL
jgi:hypothetical protein